MRKAAAALFVVSALNRTPLSVSFVRCATTGPGGEKKLFGSLIKQTDIAQKVLCSSRSDDYDNSFRGSSPIKPSVIFVLGGPGSGKGTQCECLSKEFGYVHLSAGELLRKARESNSAEGALLEEYLKEGRIVPVELSLGLLKKAMSESGAKRFLIDGFPRNRDNLEGWERIIGDEIEVSCVLFLDVPETILEARLLRRGLQSGRSDDNLETARKRFKTFTETTLPIVHHFQERGLASCVDGSADVDTVLNHTRAALLGAIQRELLACTRAQIEAALSNNQEAYREFCSPGATGIGEKLGLRHEKHDTIESKSPEDIELWGCIGSYKLSNVRSKV